MRRTLTRRIAAPALLVALAATGCGTATSEPESIVDRSSLTIGVKGDQPGLGVDGPDGHTGFDIDVAVYVADKLGVPRDRITFKTTDSGVREKALADRDVDMIFATYSITPLRKQEVTFGGPYYIAHQDTLVRASDTSINDVRDLDGKRICAVTGSNSAKRVIDERQVDAKPVKVATYGDCMKGLAARRLDAVSTDDLILAGFAGEANDVRIINQPFTDEKYGVGLHKGDLTGCEAVNRALTEMYQDGTAARLLNRWFSKSGLNLTPHVPQFEGCS